MAEIHHIVVPKQSDDTRRHLAALVRAVETGADLGPRSLHIRSLGSSLERMLTELRREQELLLASPEALPPQARALLSDVPRLVTILEPLVERARTFPD